MRGLIAVALLVMSAGVPPVGATDDSGGREVVVGVQYGTPPSRSDGGDGDRCTWVPAGATSTTGGLVVDVRVVGTETQRLFVRSCPRDIALVWIGDRSPAELSALVSDHAKALVPAPTFGSAPADAGVVNADMWLWTDPADYRPVSTRVAWVPTATVPIWAQATATPVRLVFDSGEPGAEPIVCDGPGQAWAPALGDDATSPCTYRYRHSSEIAGGTFTARWSIVWEVVTSGSAGTTRTEIVTTTSVPMVVEEIQALVVG